MAKRTKESSTFSRFVKSAIRSDQQMLSEREDSLPKHSLIESESFDSKSPLDELYASSDFIRAWDNNVSQQVGQNVIRLRTYRKLSQQQVADEMRTSQSAIARIEGGDENITLNTLKRLIHALRGHLYIAIPPQEMNFARPAEWWSSGLTMPWAVRWVAHRNDGEREQAIVGLERDAYASEAGTLPADPPLQKALAN